MTAAAAMVWATHRDWTAAEVAGALTSTATPLTKLVPNRSSGYGVLNVSRALHARKLPDSHEPNDWVRCRLAQRPLRPGAVVVASLGWAGDDVDAYTVDVPKGATVGQSCGAARKGSRCGGCRSGTTDAVLWAYPRKRLAGVADHPARRSLAAGRRPRAGRRALHAGARGGPGSPGAEAAGISDRLDLRADSAVALRPRARHQVKAPPSSTTLPIR